MLFILEYCKSGYVGILKFFLVFKFILNIYKVILDGLVNRNFL